MNIPIKLGAIIGCLIVVSGVSGYIIGTDMPYTVSSVPNFQITGNGSTDVGVPVHLGIRYDSIPPGKPSGYMWFADGNISIGSNMTAVFNNPGKYQITLRISMENNKTQRNEYANEIVNPNPSIKAFADPTNVTIGQNIHFTSLASNGTGPYSFSWYYDAQVSQMFVSGVPMGQGANITYAFKSSGRYPVSVVAYDHFGELATNMVYVNVS